jgi:TPR repeat protein
MAAYGRGDYPTALQEFWPLAQAGNAAAQHNLGAMYHQGRGVPQDDAQAVTWWRRAAEQGHATAQLNLGAMYHQGRGVPQDYALAMLWYRRAAAQGDAGAQFLLGLMNEAGHGAPQDYQQAYFWVNLAAAHVSQIPGQLLQEKVVRDRDRVAAYLTPAQLAEAQAQARTWQPKPETPGVPPVAAPVTPGPAIHR